MFYFKEFAINQDNAPFKIGTDGVLLGAFTANLKADKVLEIGTGTGLIALMIAQKSNANIQAIEINETAFQIAKENFSNSPWKGKLAVKHISLQDYCNETGEKFDLIVCNPPFFENSLKSIDESKNTARHTDSLTTTDLLKGCLQLLHPKGKIMVIYPVGNTVNLEKLASEKGLNVIEKIKIHPTIDKPAKRIILTLSYSDKECTNKKIAIEKEKRHDYTAAYIDLTKDYFLKF